jgi:hypothetical protein
MPLLKSGLWVPTLSPKQLEVFNCTSRYLLLSGARWTAKTTAALHRIIRHAWETPDARVAMFAKTTKSGKQGIWSDVQWCLREWLQDGMSSPHGMMEFTVEPKIDGATRMHYFRIRNFWGGESEIQLHSLDFDDDIEAKLLNTRFSLIYFAELQNFESRAVFDLSIQQLRMYGLPYESHQWISDTNPPEIGADHFAYKIWYEERVAKDFPEYCKTEADRALFRRRQKELKLYEFEFKDNPFLDPQQLADLRATYANDPDGWARFVEGKWTKGGIGRRLFPGFRVETHVAGTTRENDENSEYLNPSDGCHTLYIGWDTGEVNHAVAILQKRWNSKGLLCWDVLDEAVSLGEEVYLWDFASDVSHQMDSLEEICNKKNTMVWVAWSDSSLERFSSTNPQNEAAIVENVCGNRLQLQFAYEAKAPNAVGKRVQLLQRLVAEGRILVSAHCLNTITMFREINKRRPRPGQSNRSIIETTNPHKHIFDALSYPIYCEMMEEAATTEGPSYGRRGPPSPKRYITEMPLF